MRITFYGESRERYTAEYRHLAEVNQKLRQKDRYGRYSEVRIEKGEIIGSVENTGNVVSRGIPVPILCFAMTKNDKPIDPYKVFFKANYTPPRVAMNVEGREQKLPERLRVDYGSNL